MNTIGNFVFFGTGGLLSSISLSGLIRNGFKPSLVIIQRNDQTPYPNLTKEICELNGLSFTVAHSIHETAVLEAMHNCNPVLGIIASFGEVIREPLLGSFPIYNLHMGILPDYRGAFTNFWKILNNDDLYGASLHLIEKKLDAGLLVATVERDYADVVFSCDFFRKNYEMAAELLVERLPELLKGKVSGSPIDTTKGKYYRKHTEHDMELAPEEDVLNLYKKINRLQFYGQPSLYGLKLSSAELLIHEVLPVNTPELRRINDRVSLLTNGTGQILLKHY